MQMLSILPSKYGVFEIPKLDYEPVSSCLGRIRDRRRKRLGVVVPVCSRSSSDVLLISRNFRAGRIRVFSMNTDFGCSRWKVILHPRLKEGNFVNLAFSIEGQEIETELIGQEVCVDGFSREIESENVDFRNLDSGKACDSNEHKGEETGEAEPARINVRALAYRLGRARTVEDVDEVLKEKGVLPLQVYSAMIRGFGKDKKIDCAIALVEWLRRKKSDTNGVISPNLFIYNSLLGAVKESEQFGKIENVLNEMDREGISRNVVTYNTLMAAYLEQGEPDKALRVLEELDTKGFTPTPVSYSTALLAYRRMEDGNGALKFFLELKEKYSRGEIGKDGNEDWGNEFRKLDNFITRICYQVMRRWLVKKENLSTNVLKLLTEMDTAGLKPGREEHERLVWACTREEHYPVGKELYKRIRGRYSDISLSVCNHLIWLMGKAKKWWAALEIYEDMLDKGPKPNNMSYELIISHFNILLTAASKRGIWRWGIRLLDKMEDKGLKPGSRQWNAVLVACSKASETTAAVQIFRRMIEQGEKPTIISYGALLSALEKGKLYDEALRVWQHMLKVGIEPNLYAYTIMASIFAGEGKFKLVDEIINEMGLSNIEPTVITYNAIISACARNNMSSAAYEWFHRMKVRSISPNEITYTTLIEGLANDGKPRLAYELYLRAREEGLVLSPKVYDAVVESSQTYGGSIDLEVLGPRPPRLEKGKNIQINKNLSDFTNFADVPRRFKPVYRKEIHSK